MENESKRILKEWRKFVSGEPTENIVISPCILNSWIRSRDLNVNPFEEKEPSLKCVSEDELNNRLIFSSEFVGVASAYLEMVSGIVQGSRLRFDIVDKDGCCLKIYGDQEVVEIAKSAGLKVGALVTEESIGTNAASLAHIENKSIQILGSEHYKEVFHHLNCSATPIHNSSGQIIGIVSISSYNVNQNKQTLAFSKSIAENIETRMALDSKLKDLKSYNESLDLMMQYLPNGVLLIDKNKGIVKYNHILLELLEINQNQEKSNLENKIKSCLTNIDLLHEINNEEVIFQVGNAGRKKSIILSIKDIVHSDFSIAILEDTDKLIKLNSSILSSNAFYNLDSIIGEAPNIKITKELAKKVANSNTAVMIQGESGTGKEVFSQAIHNISARSGNPFVAINCGAIPSELIESELFGYESGSFTGALKGGKPGKLELASGGTLFLDEVESMPLNVQIKLLRALSSYKIVRVGGVDEIPIDIRIISATKKDLLEEVDQGNFREDLYYRINVFTIKLPPLRERGEDIKLLALHYIKRLSENNQMNEFKVEDSFFDALSKYYWRGNVRELINVIERAVLLSADNELRLENLPDKIIQNYYSNEIGREITRNIPYENQNVNILDYAAEVTIAYILDKSEGNISQAANQLGIARSTLYEKIRKSETLLSAVNSYNK